MTGHDDDARLNDAQQRTAKIRELNDQLRRGRGAGRMAVTRGIIALGEGHVAAIVAQMQAFENFSSHNDPHGEHDFGAFEHSGDTIFWKIDYYDVDCQYGSADPADASITTRVLTILLASEY